MISRSRRIGVTEPGYITTPEACHTVPVSLCETGAQISNSLNDAGVRCVHVGIMQRVGDRVTRNNSTRHV